MLLASLVALLLSARSGAAAPALAIRLPHRHRRPRLRRTALASTALTSLCTAARLLHALGSQVLGAATVPPAPLLVELLLRAPGTLRAKITHAAAPYVGAAEQDPVHPEPAATSPEAASASGPICVHPCASVVPFSLAVHRTDATSGASAPSTAPDHGKKSEPQMHADARRWSEVARSAEQNPIHLDPASAENASPASPAHTRRHNPIHPETARGAARPAARPPLAPPEPDPTHHAPAPTLACTAEPAPKRANACQDPMHPEPVAISPEAAPASGPIGVHRRSSVVPLSLAASRTDAASGDCVPRTAPGLCGELEPQMNADERRCSGVARSAGQNPMQLEPPSGKDSSPASPAHTKRQNPIHPEQSAAPRTGPLRNGNRRGNPNAAPRCGAKTRSGCPCRAPAIRGKLRCRMHGGASTGPRTPEGLERLRAARTTHGRGTAAMRAQHRFRLTFLRRGRVQLAAYQQEARLPPAAQARLHALPPELAMPPYPPPDQPPPSRAEERAIATAEAEALAPWKLAIGLARASRHAGGSAPAAAAGIDRIFRRLPPVPTPPW